MRSGVVTPLIFLSLSSWNSFSQVVEDCSGVTEKIKDRFFCADSFELMSCSAQGKIAAGAMAGMTSGAYMAKRALEKDVRDIERQVQESHKRNEEELRTLRESPQENFQRWKRNFEENIESTEKQGESARLRLKQIYRNSRVSEFVQEMKDKFPQLVRADTSPAELKKVIDANPSLLTRALNTGSAEEILEAYHLERRVLESELRVSELIEAKKKGNLQAFMQSEEKRLLRYKQGLELASDVLKTNEASLSKLVKLEKQGIVSGPISARNLVVGRFIAGGLLGGMLGAGVGLAFDSFTSTGCDEHRHLYTDVDERCHLTGEVGDKTLKFLSSGESEQREAFLKSPELCRDYKRLLKMVESPLRVSSHQCFNSEKAFRVIAEKTNGESLQLDFKKSADEFGYSRVEFSESGGRSALLVKNGKITGYEVFRHGRWHQIPLDANAANPIRAENIQKNQHLLIRQMQEFHRLGQDCPSGSEDRRGRGAAAPVSSEGVN